MFTPNEVIRSVVEVKVTAKRSDASSAPYMINCDHNDVVDETTGKFPIIATVMQGQTPVKHANIFARISLSESDDPDAAENVCYYPLLDDGKTQTSGDVHKLDGLYTYIR